jgi:hypothetical protein
MATAAQITAAILEAAGRPDTGWIAENAEAIADKIVSLDNVSTNGAAEQLTREKRVTEIEEIR